VIFRAIRVDRDAGLRRMGQRDRVRHLVGDSGNRHQLGRLGPAREIRAGDPAFSILQLGGFMRNGPIAIEGQAAPLGHWDAQQFLASMRLDRVPPDASDNPGHFASFGRFLKLFKTLPSTSGLCPWLRMIVYCWMNVMVLFAIQ